MVMYGYGKPKRLTSLGSLQRASVLRWNIEIASRRGGGSIQRSAESRGTFHSLLPSSWMGWLLGFVIGQGTYQSRYIRRQNSSRQCWRPNASRRRGGGNIRVRGKASPSRRGRRWSLRSRRSVPFFFLAAIAVVVIGCIHLSFTSKLAD